MCGGCIVAGAEYGDHRLEQPSPQQLAFLNDLGIEDKDLQGMTRANASAKIEERLPLLDRFRATHGGKWTTGRQRAALKKVGVVDKDFDTLSMDDAAALLNRLYENNKVPPTDKQMALLEKKGYKGKPPKTRAKASELIKNLIFSDDKATDKQLKFIKERGMAPKVDLNRLTKAQARAIINTFMRRAALPKGLPRQTPQANDGSAPERTGSCHHRQQPSTPPPDPETESTDDTSQEEDEDEEEAESTDHSNYTSDNNSSTSSDDSA